MLSLSVRRRSRLAALTVACALVTFVAPACRQATEPVAAPTFTGRWMDRTWEGDAASVRLATPVGDSLVVFGASPPNSGQVAQEALNISIPFRGVGTYVLGVNDIELVELVGGDGVVARYVGIGAESGQLQITSYDELSQRIEGTVSFDARRTGTGNHPVLHFEEGHFQATIRSIP